MRDIVDGRYQVEQKLAAGGFGTIYRVTDLAIGRAVAMKVLHRELAGDPSVVARFRREAAALARLKSPHTLTLYDVGETDETLYLVMELLHGQSLQEVFDRTGPLSWRRMANIARGVCGSLREAHACGIVHRDLKPANIFLATHAHDQDFVKVLDFGIAKVLASSELPDQDLTRHGQMIGTFDYMAPEQMVGGRCTAKSDVFTLGVVIYEMITGRRPYGTQAGPAQMLMALLTTTPRAMSGVPADVARTVMKCLAREPHERPELDELDGVLEHALALDEGTFGDSDEPTLVEVPIPVAAHPLARTTRPRGSAGRVELAAIASSAGPAADATVNVRDIPIRALHEGERCVGPTVNARGSCASLGIERAIEEELACADTAFSLARGSDIAIAPVTETPVVAPRPRVSTLELAHTVELRNMASAGPAQRSRIASGTAPIVDAANAGAAPVDAAHADTDRLEAAPVPVQAPGVLPGAPPNTAVNVVRYLVIAACLFGLGFLAALALASR